MLSWGGEITEGRGGWPPFRPCPGYVILVAASPEDSLLCLSVGGGNHGDVQDGSVPLAVLFQQGWDCWGLH